MTAGPDIAAARAFLARLDPESEAFTLQTFDDTPAKRREAARVHEISLANGALEDLAKWNAHGAGIFVTVNRTDGKGRQTHNVESVRALFLDLDGAPLGPVVEAKPSPQIVVESSGGRYHAYWLCDDCPREDFPRVQRALAARFGGDASVHDLPRVMRLPGFVHRKGEPFLTRVMWELCNNAPPYTLAEIVGGLGLKPEADTPPHSGAQPGRDKVTQGGRNAHLFALGRSMTHKGFTQPAVLAALQAENAARCEPPLSDEQVRYNAERAFLAKDSYEFNERGQHRAAEQSARPEAGDSATAADSDGPRWPDPLDPAAFHGIGGEFVRMVEPNTEADPAAILLQFLAAFGALVGRGPHYKVEGDEHHANLYVLLVGPTAKGRKGTAWSRVREVFERVPDWKPHVSGLSSGEGVKYHVRDAREETKPSKNH